MSVTKGQFWTGVSLIVALLGVLMGLVASSSGSSSQVIYSSRPAASSTHVPAGQSNSIVYTGNPFSGPQASTDTNGNSITLFSCASGLTAVDLPMGKSYVSGGNSISINEDASDTNQTFVSVGIKLGPNTGLPGIIVHGIAGANDPLYSGTTSDKTLATRLAPGGQNTYTLDTNNYTPYGVGNDEISSVTFCIS